MMNKFKYFFSANSDLLPGRLKMFKTITDIIERAGGDNTYDWINDKIKRTPVEVFTRSVEAIKSADTVIAEISVPSTAVGQQISLAVQLKIPVVALYEEDKRGVSRYTLGGHSAYLFTSSYRKLNLKKVVKSQLDLAFRKRFIKFNFISTREINDYLDKESRKEKISKSDLLRKIINRWIQDHTSAQS